jgi:rhodanese-related sulfurtransferase
MDFLIHNPQNLFWLAAAIVSGYMLFGRNVIGDPDSITPQQAVLLLNKEDAIVVDVRDQAEFSAGHLPNARHIPLKDIESRSGELKKFSKRPFILVCQSGKRSRAALAVLRKAGYERIFNLNGGLTAWTDAGQPLARG